MSEQPDPGQDGIAPALGSDGPRKHTRPTASRGSSSGHIRLQAPSINRNKSNFSVREVIRLARESEEHEELLSEHERADDHGCYPPHEADHVQAPNPHADLPVYTTIHRIRRLIIAAIDDPYDLVQLKSPGMNATIVRPLVDHLYNPNDVSIVYCLLVNRVHFVREQTYQHHHQSVNMTRASLCELVASRVLRRYDENRLGKDGLLLLANVLVAGFEPFQNAPKDIVLQKPAHWSLLESLTPLQRREKILTALEVAIVSEAKTFLSSTSCQKLVDAVWRGRITYTPTSWLDIVPDKYKRRAISIYDPRRAPILNQYRLIVPRTRNIIETTHFFVLFLLYVWAMYTKGHRVGPSHLIFSTQELIFAVYGIGWTLDEMTSMLEHGWSVHTENLWSFLDLTFVAIFAGYFGLRVHGFTTNDPAIAKQALDVLALAAPVLLPRLAFCLMSESMLFIALRAMMADFFFLSVLAAWLFGGFLLALRWLSQSQEGLESFSTVTIAKWLLMLWFGLDGTGLQKSAEMHKFIGPALTVLFALLGNTLFLTILVAMLSDTYSKLAASATAEIQFRRAVLTFEGVKSDALFSYPPPFNVLFLFVLLPLKLTTSPRWFHKLNVVFVRVLNAPVLLGISLYERAYLWKKISPQVPGSRGSRTRHGSSFWGNFGAHADLQLVFGHEPPENVIDEMDALDAEFADELWWSSAAFAAAGGGGGGGGGTGSVHRYARRSSSADAGPGVAIGNSAGATGGARRQASRRFSDVESPSNGQGQARASWYDRVRLEQNHIG